MMRNGGRMQDWMKYAALAVLAVLAFGVAALALMNPGGLGGAAEPLPASVQVATPAATASPSAPAVPTATATPASTATATAPPAGIELPAEPVVLILGDSYTAGDGADSPDQGWAYPLPMRWGIPPTSTAWAAPGSPGRRRAG
ncbi:hypothetical protein [Arthrobacter sp. SD76]|uniref:hypothetical protein n=1 Tax=Arthrobacter sp. SD76 TaxID=3415007 RepID=UPI003C722E15